MPNVSIFPGVVDVAQRKPDEESSKMRKKVGSEPSTTHPALKLGDYQSKPMVNMTEGVYADKFLWVW